MMIIVRFVGERATTNRIKEEEEEGNQPVARPGQVGLVTSRQARPGHQFSPVEQNENEQIQIGIKIKIKLNGFEVFGKS